MVFFINKNDSGLHCSDQLDKRCKSRSSCVRELYRPLCAYNEQSTPTTFWCRVSKLKLKHLWRDAIKERDLQLRATTSKGLLVFPKHFSVALLPQGRKMQASSSHNDSDLKRKLDSFETEDSAIERKKQSLEKDKPSALEAITVNMDCPALSVGAIIGKKGANVQEIMRRSGCRIVIDQSDTREGVPKKVNLTGPPDKLAVAMALVSLIIKDGANALFAEGEPSDNSSVKSTLLQSESRCPKSKVGEVIGIKGATIAEIMRRSSCKVRIVQEAADGNASERQVVYNGTIEQISEAKALVQTVIDQGVSVLGIIVADHTNRRTADRYDYKFVLGVHSIRIILYFNDETSSLNSV